ncbi:MAG: primosomal protein N' [Gammaproteobacteria bacterium]|nr:primosomal protein N' [Gammaproteobacteria bacterium]
MQETPSVLRISIPSPLRRLFDYLPASQHEFDQMQLGIRLEVPFGSRKAVGLLVEKANSTEFDQAKLKFAADVLDHQSLLSDDILALLKWVAGYYHHPPGEVFFSALPTLLRKGKSIQPDLIKKWCLTDAGNRLDVSTLGQRATRQKQLLVLLKSTSATSENALDAKQLDKQLSNWRPIMAKLVEKQLVICQESQELITDDPVCGTDEAVCREGHRNPNLNEAQQTAVQQVVEKLHQYCAFLLEGVTGSGKTEVYLRIIEQVISQGQQALVLVPEIGLTPQMISRFRSRFNCQIAVFHSGLNDKERLDAWLMARAGKARVIIGTRSAVFTPAPDLGVIILDEEHDLSFKQQDGFRYSARDVAVKRAHQNGIPVVMGSATPSLECLYNVHADRYSHLLLPERVAGAQFPQVRLLDVRAVKMHDGLSPVLLQQMRQHLQKGNQVLLFLNRRGFAPALLCHDCGWVSHCQRCDANMTIHQRDHRLRCHHCGADKPLMNTCPQCTSSELHTYGVGTEKVEQSLNALFADKKVIRIDRDTTRRKGAFESILEKVNSGEGQILIGTQLLAKGHHFPNVTLVGILNTDNELFSSDFRASERMAQLVVQVAGRAGRAEKPGEVLIQTHQPEHPLLQILIKHGYKKFAQIALEERRQADLPPYVYLALLRAEAVNMQAPLAFLQAALDISSEYNLSGNNLAENKKAHVSFLGPLPAPMEKRAGRYRAQLLLQSSTRASLHQLLQHWTPRLETLKQARKVRWSLDVDPMEMF